MLTLRLSRAGTKKRPVYHLVAADKRARRDGRFVENLGYYIPARNVLVLKQDRIDYWLSVGAATTEVARRLILKAKKDGNIEPAAKPKYVAPPVKPVEVKADAKKGSSDKKAETKAPPEAKPAKSAAANEKKD
ncbi:MAG: 30S ribosomal protein S16 [Myxococcota bacterium]